MRHLYPLLKSPPDEENGAASRWRATKKNLPLLKGTSLYRLTLKPKAVREAHWHANADELGFVAEGELLITFYANGNHFEQFTATKGDSFFIPSGALHLIENRGAAEAELLLQFSHEEPEDFALSSTFALFSDKVLVLCVKSFWI